MKLGSTTNIFILCIKKIKKKPLKKNLREYLYSGLCFWVGLVPLVVFLERESMDGEKEEKEAGVWREIIIGGEGAWTTCFCLEASKLCHATYLTPRTHRFMHMFCFHFFYYHVAPVHIIVNFHAHRHVVRLSVVTIVNCLRMSYIASMWNFRGPYQYMCL